MALLWVLLYSGVSGAEFPTPSFLWWSPWLVFIIDNVLQGSACLMQLAKSLEHTFSCQFYHKLFTAEDKNKLWQQAPVRDQNSSPLCGTCLCLQPEQLGIEGQLAVLRGTMFNTFISCFCVFFKLISPSVVLKNNASIIYLPKKSLKYLLSELMAKQKDCKKNGVWVLRAPRLLWGSWKIVKLFGLTF